MHEDIGSRLKRIRDRIEEAAVRSGRRGSDVRLIAVTKTHPPQTIRALVDLGIRDIGENRVQELEAKAPAIHGDVEFHMIGHLQRNKVKKVLPHVEWIQSIDSNRLVDTIERYAQQQDRRIKALVEVNTTREPAKTGCDPAQALELCEKVAQSPHMEFRGLMTVGPLSVDERVTREAFSSLRRLGERCRSLTAVVELSMGMSSDFVWAIEEGATMVRIGSLLLGSRPRR